MAQAQLNSVTPLEAARFEGRHDAKRVGLYTLRNAGGMTVRFTNLGAKILQIIVPDRDGAMDDVALGYDSLAQVLQGQASMGAFVGRYANRIARGQFTLDGKVHQITANNNGQLLHGGAKGSCLRTFDVIHHEPARASLGLYYESAQDGFPGNLVSRVDYALTDQNELVIEYDAICDSPTVVNMTCHVFFNLSGQRCINAASLLAHRLTLLASHYTPVDANQIPTGAISPVAGTAMDFRDARSIGERLHEACTMHEPHTGYDHNWVLDKPAGKLGLAARLEDTMSGRVMEVLSTEPGIVFYGGNNLAAQAPRDRGKGGVLYERYSGLCLEPAHFPDSPNHPHFPSTVLRPGQTFSGRTVYRFFA